MLIAKNISKRFGQHEILKGVNLTLQSGKITVLIGPSGSGKTTLLRAVSLIEPPDSGTIELNSYHYSFPTTRKIEPKPWPLLTVVFQQFFLWPHLTLKDNILLPASNIPNDKLTEELKELIDALKMHSFIHRYPNEASLGQRQRVALARAIMLKPKIILMDEITSALDVEQVNAILEFLPRLKAAGVGILLITHLINFARKTADEVLFLDDGHIVERGPISILSAPSSDRLRAFLSVVEAAT